VAVNTIAGLAAESHRRSIIRGDHVNFGVPPASGIADRLWPSLFESAHGVWMHLDAGAIQTKAFDVDRNQALPLKRLENSLQDALAEYSAVRSEVAGCRYSRCPVATAGTATAARIANQSIPSRLDEALNFTFVLTGPNPMYEVNTGDGNRGAPKPLPSKHWTQTKFDRTVILLYQVI
jgi:hypothetical protein